MKTIAFATFKPALFQIALWCGFAAIIIAAHSTLSLNRTLILTICVRVGELAVLYNVHQVLYHRYFTVRQYRRYGVLFALTLALCGVGLQGFRVWSSSGVIPMWNLADIAREILAAGLFFMMIMGITAFVQHKRNEYAMQEARQEARALQAASELKMLQAQINPHFLFNTLHSLYSLISLRSEASQEKAQEVVLMLADLMRYMYQTANADTVRLSEEVENIKRFLALHRLRLGKRATLCFEASGDLEAWHIPPLLLLTFVENAIKHGVETVARGAELKARLTVGADVSFCITNSKVPLNLVQHESAIAQTARTGLANVRRRLELLYPNRFELAIDEETTSFSVHLQLLNATRRSA
jgi:two-component system, LytTR family, sensor kinase